MRHKTNRWGMEIKERAVVREKEKRGVRGGEKKVGKSLIQYSLNVEYDI